MIKVDGQEELERELKGLAKRYGKETVDAANLAGEIVRSEAIRSIQSKSGGDIVTRYREGGGQYDHQASKPGDAPNTDTGRLVQSIQVERTAKYVFVGSTLKYAGMLEFGTRNMDARPWLNPAVESKRRDIEKMFKLQIGKVSRTL